MVARMYQQDVPTGCTNRLKMVGTVLALVSRQQGCISTGYYGSKGASALVTMVARVHQHWLLW